jgi:DNA-binding transcriptional ArsR family regulator
MLWPVAIPLPGDSTVSALPALDVIQEPRRAAAVLHPLRRQILDALAEPGSASSLARTLGLPRQKINYHLRELEDQGFVEAIEERKRGNCVERIVRATAAHYLISPDLGGSLDEDEPPITPDRFSSAYLIAAAARLIRDVAEMRRRAAGVGKPLPTLTLQTDIRFRSATDRNAFAEELSQTVAQLAAKYHDETAERGRPYRFVLGAHPVITKTPEQARAEELAAQRNKKEPDDD